MEYRLSDNRVAHLLELADELLSGTAAGVEECPRYNSGEESGL